MKPSDLQQSLNDLVQLFHSHANPAKAIEMEKYMKVLFPYLGLQRAEREALAKPFLLECKKMAYPDIEYLVRELWAMDAREFQYLAIQIMLVNKTWKHRGSIALFEWILVRKSWWDSVDAIASNCIGNWLLKYPENMARKVQEWTALNNIWTRRTAIIFQLKYRDKTDTELLFKTIKKFSAEKEFFIAKAIGWALRQLSYTQPEMVLAFCEQNELQPLSRREALRGLKRTGQMP